MQEMTFVNTLVQFVTESTHPRDCIMMIEAFHIKNVVIYKFLHKIWLTMLWYNLSYIRYHAGRVKMQILWGADEG